METIRTDTLDRAMSSVGLPLPRGLDVQAGAVSRFDDPEGGKGNKALWVRPFPDGLGAVFGNWRTDQAYTWQKSCDRAMTQAEAQAFRQQVEASRKEARDAREAEYRAAAVKARGRWDKAQAAGEHAYLTHKAIQAHGCRIEGKALLVPVHDRAGEIQSLQAIQPDGGKRFLTGGKMAGGRFWIGEPGPILVLAEGFATGAAIHEATGLPVCVAFNAGNLPIVARDVRAQHQDARIILAADNDIHPDRPNVGHQKAQEAAKAVRGAVALPEMDGRACDWWDVWHEKGTAGLKAAFTPEPDSPPNDVHPPRFQLLGRDDLRKLPDLQWRVDGVLPMDGIGLVIGQSGAGKSFVTLDLLARVSLGLSWFGHDTRACKTVYVGLEGRAGIKRRIEAWEQQHGQQVPDGFAVVLDTLKLTEPEDVQDLARAILAAGGQGGLIVIDTLAQASPGTDENSSADMGVLVAALQRLQTLVGSLVLAVHHMGKDAGRGARGHSSLYAACDVAISITKAGDLITVSTSGDAGGKSKDAEPVEHAAALGRVVLHTTDDGQEIAGACIVETSEAPKTRLSKGPKGGNVKVVWDALGDMLRDAGDVRPAGAPDELPEGRPAVPLDDAVAKIAPMLTCVAKRQVERTRSAITSLMNSGLLVHVGGWLWAK
ncbi:MAG: AAA family ATPase [Castellaniella sp.]|uniref:AAA family ATPase n=1 Tax=Castellaniella sp. TaxID=1955812 RepID=UPI003C74F9A0